MEQKTLRDEFAMAAMTGYLASKRNGVLRFSPDDDANYIYQIADAMLTERASKPIQDSNPQEKSPDLKEAVLNLLPVIDAPTSAAFKEAVVGVYKSLGLNPEDGLL